MEHHRPVGGSALVIDLIVVDEVLDRVRSEVATPVVVGGVHRDLRVRWAGTALHLHEVVVGSRIGATHEVVGVLRTAADHY